MKEVQSLRLYRYGRPYDGVQDCSRHRSDHSSGGNLSGGKSHRQCYASQIMEVKRRAGTSLRWRSITTPDFNTYPPQSGMAISNDPKSFGMAGDVTSRAGHPTASSVFPRSSRSRRNHSHHLPIHPSWLRYRRPRALPVRASFPAT